MTKRKVNLFHDPLKKVKRGQDQYRIIRIASIILSSIFFVIIVLTFLLQSKYTGDLFVAQEEILGYQEAISNAKIRSKEIYGVSTRINIIKDALTKDINYASKSSLLKNHISDLGLNLLPDNISFSSTKDFTASLVFPAQSDLFEFLRVSETNEFKKIFKSFSVDTFDISISTDSTKLVPIDVSGNLL